MVNVNDMLIAREIRVQRQKDFLANCTTLICFTLNIAGPVKTNAMIMRAFDEGVLLIKNRLSYNKFKIQRIQLYDEPTGPQAYFLLYENAHIIKNIMVDIEESCDLGRIFDIDVHSTELQISRESLNFKQRNCLICNKNGKGCARQRAHSVEQLANKTEEIITSYFNDKISSSISQTAIKALLYEVAVSPKPGLVDRFDNGAHKDMDFFTFINSSTVLFHYFKKCALIALQNKEQEPGFIFSKLRYQGICAEQAMLKETGNVNTHKGSIFSLGILVACTCLAYTKEGKINLDKVFEHAKEMGKISLKDFENMPENTKKTNGEVIYRQYGIHGIRGVAADGFKIISDVSLVKLKKYYEKTYDINEAALYTFVEILSVLEDTNIINRSCVDDLRNVQNSAKNILKKNNLNIVKEMELLNNDFIMKNISPGGCADILAATLFFYYLTL